MIYEKGKYFEFVDENYIKPAPLTVVKDGMQISYPSDEIYEELGYKIKITDERPEADETHYIRTYYENAENAIIEHFQLIEVTEDELE